MSSDTSTGVRPFQADIPQAALEDLRRRLRETRWPAYAPDEGWQRGVPLHYLVDLARYWAEEFDWRKQEAALNDFPQFVFDADGQPVHFIHVRSPEPEAVPLVLTHGWPSAPVEFLKVVGPLTDPRAHGGDPRDAFHLVLPSLPGYGFSTPLNGAGWGNLFRVAQTWQRLMTALGYQRYGAHGSDVGAGVSTVLTALDASRIIGLHQAGTIPKMPFGPPIELDGLDARDRVRAERFNRFQQEGLGYLQLQSTRPQTLSYALTDSPVAQLAWIVEKFHEWTDPAHELPDHAVDRDQLLTLVSIFWFTQSGGSAAHGVYEGMQAYREMAAAESGDAGWSGGDEGGARPPSGVAVFAGDNTMRSVFDPGREVRQWTEFDRGGHFPAMEAPDLLVQDLRDFFRGLR